MTQPLIVPDALHKQGQRATAEEADRIAKLTNVSAQKLLSHGGEAFKLPKHLVDPTATVEAKAIQKMPELRRTVVLIDGAVHFVLPHSRLHRELLRLLSSPRAAAVPRPCPGVFEIERDEGGRKCLTIIEDGAPDTWAVIVVGRANEAFSGKTAEQRAQMLLELGERVRHALLVADGHLCAAANFEALFADELLVEISGATQSAALSSAELVEAQHYQAARDERLLGAVHESAEWVREGVLNDRDHRATEDV